MSVHKLQNGDTLVLPADAVTGTLSRNFYGSTMEVDETLRVIVQAVERARWQQKQEDDPRVEILRKAVEKAAIRIRNLEQAVGAVLNPAIADHLRDTVIDLETAMKEARAVARGETPKPREAT